MTNPTEQSAYEKAKAAFSDGVHRPAPYDLFCFRAGWGARAEHDRAEIERLRELLERGNNAIEWYRDEHPDSWSEADEEYLSECQQALQESTEQQAKGVEK